MIGNLGNSIAISVVSFVAAVVAGAAPAVAADGVTQNSTITLAPDPSSAASPVPPAGPPKSTTSLERPELLTMATALAKAARNNPAMVERRIQQEVYELTYDIAWSKMWMPTIGLNVTANAPYTIYEAPGSPEAGADTQGGRVHGTNYWPAAGLPNTFMPGVQMQIGQYNIFNFGKDKAALKSAELEVERSRETLRELMRAVRFQVIQAVFNYKTRSDLLDAAQRSVEAAESVAELVKSRVSVGRASKSDLASSQIDMLNARNVLVSAQGAFSAALWGLNQVLGDPIGHPYTVKTEVKYIKFRMPLDDVLSVFRTNCPQIKDAKKTLEQRRIDLTIAEKNALPLPTVSFSGLNIGYTFTPAGTLPNNSPGNLNFLLALGLTVPIFGDNGFFSQRAVRNAELKVAAAEVDLRNAVNDNEVQARNIYTSIVATEAAIDNDQKIFKESSDFFDAALEQLQSSATFNRLDLKAALEGLRNSELTLTTSILNHYNFKLQLADLIGVDRFPEENL